MKKVWHKFQGCISWLVTGWMMELIVVMAFGLGAFVLKACDRPHTHAKPQAIELKGQHESEGAK
jgi:hypothetical protein